jgi:glycosyltransferase involved in cell wall biosynthesis
MRASFVALGQLSERKGTLVLLEAIRLLPKRVRAQMQIEIHGSARYERADFLDDCAKLMRGLEDTVRMFGTYRPGEVSDIISRHGWVVTPSIWWENSPLVIQEAFACGRPVICSNIGGMAEKVQAGVSGLHFRVGSPGDLAAVMERAATEPGLFEQLCAGVRQPPSVAQTIDRLLEVY